MANIEFADDIVIGETYQTWGGKRLTVRSVQNDIVQWVDADGNPGSSRVRGFASLVRKPATKR